MWKPAWIASVFVLAAASPALAQDAAKTELNAESIAKAQALRKAEPQISVAGARNEDEAKARLRADAKLRECVIKPVMTDEEIQTCKTAYQMSRQAQPSTGR